MSYKSSSLVHVIVMTSDTFFIDQIYTDSILKNTPEFYLVNFFDNETAKDIFIPENISENYASRIIHISSVF